ncbi:MAG: MFS transporter [Promethearchaeota archaeon]
MSDSNLDISMLILFKSYFPIYLLSGLFSLAFSGIYIMVVPLSTLFWPDEPYHALEMGLLITSMFWVISIAGLFFGRLIDKYSRTNILFLISLLRGASMVMLSFTKIGNGVRSWLYFYVFTFIIGFSAGGNFPTVVSLSNDLVPINQRSRFFGIHKITRNAFQLIGFLLTGVLIYFNAWRFFFIGIGLAIIISGIFMKLNIKEPKRGIQRSELSQVLQEESVTYKYQLDKQMMMKTMFSKTNLTALIEGIFTSVYMGSLTILFLPYIQTDPHNISPLVTGLFLALFGLTGGLIIKLLLARLSDNISKEKSENRLYLIIFSISGGAFTFILLFFIPLPELTIEQGNNILFIFSHPIIWVMGSIYMSSSSISALYDINQPPILQEINLPEAQGQIIAINRLLESIGFGSGPLIAGILIVLTGQNYQLIALLIGLFSVPGTILWMISIKWYREDREKIKKILLKRAKELEKKNSISH